MSARFIANLYLAILAEAAVTTILVIKRLINIKQFSSIQFQLILYRSKVNTCLDVPDVSSLEVSPKSTKLANNLLETDHEIFVILKKRVELNFNPSILYFQ